MTERTRTLRWLAVVAGFVAYFLALCEYLR